MSSRKHQDMPANAKRAAAFLKLSIEQLRAIHPNLAEYLQKQHHDRLVAIFEDVAKSSDFKQLRDHEAAYSKYLEEVGGRDMASLLPTVAPPGLGLGVFSEQPVFTPPKEAAMKALPAQSTYSPSRPKHPHDFGAIGDRLPRKTSINLPPNSSKLSQLSDAVALGVACSVCNMIGHNHSSCPGRGEKDYSVTTLRDALLKSSPFIPSTLEPSKPTALASTTGSASRNESGAIKLHSQPSGTSNLPTSEKSIESVGTRQSISTPISSSSLNMSDPPTGPKSWATVAALAKSRQSPRPAPPVVACASSRPGPAVSKNGVAPPSQLRVVWIHSLPRSFTMHNLSVHIQVGPIMSMLVQDEHDIFPGRCVCIVFQYAESATEFIKACTPSRPAIAADEETQEAASSKDETCSLTTAEIHSSLHKQAPTAIVVPGSAYPTDDDLRTMAEPTNARRRVKISRSRLFYDVPLHVFKRDVYRICGGPTNVEVFHFYNPGEATIIFASVSVSRRVVAVFEEFRSGGARKGRASGASTSKNEGIYLEGMYGEDFDIGFAKDFNESPPERLCSSYAPNGGATAKPVGKTIPGLFQGPSIKWNEFGSSN